LCAADSRDGGRCCHLRNLGGRVNALKRLTRGREELRMLHTHQLRHSLP
jgi:uncharacterized protein YjiS (DUF1127 family)